MMSVAGEFWSLASFCAKFCQSARMMRLKLEEQAPD